MSNFQLFTLPLVRARSYNAYAIVTACLSERPLQWVSSALIASILSPAVIPPSLCYSSLCYSSLPLLFLPPSVIPPSLCCPPVGSLAASILLNSRSSFYVSSAAILSAFSGISS